MPEEKEQRTVATEQRRINRLIKQDAKIEKARRKARYGGACGDYIVYIKAGHDKIKLFATANTKAEAKRDAIEMLASVGVEVKEEQVGKVIEVFLKEFGDW